MRTGTKPHILKILLNWLEDVTVKYGICFKEVIITITKSEQLNLGECNTIDSDKKVYKIVVGKPKRQDYFKQV